MTASGKTVASLSLYKDAPEHWNEPEHRHKFKGGKMEDRDAIKECLRLGTEILRKARKGRRNRARLDPMVAFFRDDENAKHPVPLRRKMRANSRQRDRIFWIVAAKLGRREQRRRSPKN